MDKAGSEKSIIALEGWLQTPAGVYLRAWEQSCLDNLTADIFGYNAVQIGMPQMDALAASRMPYKILADRKVRSADEPARAVSVTLDYTELPFASQSIDLVVLPHVLEFSTDPHQVLREVERVLIPEGQVVICGFNPASLWGARHVLRRVGGTSFLPRTEELISMPRMKDWLKLLNMSASQSHFGCYAPACRTEKWLNRYAFMDNAGSRWWPYLGGVYIVQAIKRVKGMRLIGPAWSRKTANAPVAVPVTNKQREQQDGR
ncbi:MULTISPECIES: class I SAM-dependent methyltransferase [Duganella]|jgi:SAM-dependent methyltransferase|uniref:Class I SAM-dependent methyltransferase n=2 Tax=Duganella TaxID=75654 RepID=A0ABX6MFQ6_9BURK|nr:MULTISPECIES: class I SAM-dependent methyltransferase [Duganella]MYN30126.1 methyltransferase domain-containing protein [Duganella levis]QJD93016.1 class I SAM-dependent methyltransferase [Duganella dendranthematis]